MAKRFSRKAKVKVDVSLLDKIKEAEYKLANEGRPKDLEGLPPGHPLLVQFEQAQQRWESRQVAEQEGVKQHKVSRKKTSRQRSTAAIREAEERAAEIKKSVKAINKKIGDLQKRAIDLSKTVKEQEVLTQYPFARVRMVRLSRMLLAFHRGLDDSKLSPIRFESTY